MVLSVNGYGMVPAMDQGFEDSKQTEHHHSRWTGLDGDKLV